MMCFVQNPKNWLILAKFENKRWKKLDLLVPYELEDTRFKRAVLYLNRGYKFYPAKGTLGQVSAVEIDEDVIEQAEKDFNSNPFRDELKLDTHTFFKNLKVEKEPTKKEIQEQKERELKMKIREMARKSTMQVPSIWA